MSLTAQAIVHKPERLYPFYRAAATLSGSAGRVSILSFHDSTGQLLLTNDNGSQYTPGDYPIGHAQAMVYALMARGFHIWGLAMTNRPPSGGTFYGIKSTGLYITEAYQMASDPAANPTLVDGRSYPFASTRLMGALFYVAGDTTYPPSNNYNSASCYLLDDPLSLSINSINGWRNQFILGNPTAVSLRVLFSYATDGASVDVKFSAWSLFSSVLHSSLRVTTDTNGEMVDASLLVPDRPTNTNNRYFSLYDPINDVRSQGAVIVSHVQWIDGAIDPTDRTTGLGGFSVTPVFICVNYTMSQLNSELYHAGADALAETLRCAVRVADRIIIDLRLLGNDIFYTGVSSFIGGTDTGVADASGGAGGSGADQSTGPGIVQNLWSFARLVDEARVIAGIAKNKIVIQWGFYHSQPDSTLQSRFVAAIDAAIAWVDSHAQYSEYFAIIRGERIATPAAMLRAGWYNGPITTVTGITTCSAGAETTITTGANHNLAAGDLVRFHATNATTASGNALNGNILNNGVDWKVASAPTNTTFTVVSPLAITGAGNTGFVFSQVDESHLRSRGLLGFNEAGFAAVSGSLEAYENAEAPRPLRLRNI